MSHPNGSTRARAEAYRFYARLFLSEPDAGCLAAPKDLAFARVSSSNPRDLRIEYTRLFTLNVFPYASVFMDPEAFLNTETTARVQSAYAQAEFEPPPGLAIGAPDHFGIELMFVAHLLETGHPTAAGEFLSSEILPWAVVFLHAVETNTREEFYRVAAQEARAWLMSDLASPVTTVPPDPVSPAGAEDDDLDSIVTWLTTPGQSGIFVSKDNVSSLARKLELPVSFGDRGLALKSLFRAAGEYERVEELLQALHELTETWMANYSQDARMFPQAAPIIQVWMKRVISTRDRVLELSQIAREST